VTIDICSKVQQALDFVASNSGCNSGTLSSAIGSDVRKIRSLLRDPVTAKLLVIAAHKGKPGGGTWTISEVDTDGRAPTWSEWRKKHFIKPQAGSGDNPGSRGRVTRVAGGRHAESSARAVAAAPTPWQALTAAPERAGDSRPRRAGRATRVHAVMEIDGSLTITQHRADGESKLFLTPGETRTLGDFLYDTKNLWA